MNETTVKKQTHPAIIVAAIIGGIIVFGALISQCSTPAYDEPTPVVSGKDQRAYDELRRNGYSADQAREAAPAIRKLCETSGGANCR